MSLGLACPACRAALELRGDSWSCPACARSYRSHHGIPDLRQQGDLYLTLEEDRARADRVVAGLEGRDLRALLEHYWSLSGETPPALRHRFIDGALRAPRRARRLVDRLTAEGLLSPAARVLEVGSGTAAFLAEAAPRVREIVGLDIALRWLHVGRRRLLDAGIACPPLVCAGGEAIPFADARFDLVVCVATLEFTRDPGRVLSECARVLRPGGSLVLNTVNRFSLAGAPQVGLWGVGFLPRGRQETYVRWRGRGSFAGVRLLSCRELERLAAARFGAMQMEPADLEGVLAERPSARLALWAYGRLRPHEPFRTLLRWLGPEWDARLVRA